MLDTGSRIPFCHACVEVLAQKLPDPLCAQCGRPIVSSTVSDGIVEPRCRLCRLQTYDFDLARSFGPYTAPMSRAILMLKYGEVTPLGGWFTSAHLALLVRLRTNDLFAADVSSYQYPWTRPDCANAGIIRRSLSPVTFWHVFLGIPFRSYLLVRTKPRPDKIRPNAPGAMGDRSWRLCYA